MSRLRVLYSSERLLYIFTTIARWRRPIDRAKVHLMTPVVTGEPATTIAEEEYHFYTCGNFVQLAYHENQLSNALKLKKWIK